MAPRFAGLPGADIVEAGLSDLAAGRLTPEGLAVASFAPRLARLGIEVPAHEVDDPAHRLYDLLAARHGDAAHGRYNALRRRLVSFARALAGLARA